jgi:hypothetical protein
LANRRLFPIRILPHPTTTLSGVTSEVDAIIMKDKKFNEVCQEGCCLS